MELSVLAARIEADYLGVESVINELRSTESTQPRAKGAATPPVPPRLFILHIDSVQELPTIKRLSSFFPGSPILVLMQAAEDPSVPIQAMRMGASQVVNLPLQAEDFKLAVDCIGEQFGTSAGRGAPQIIAIAGVTGGCGVTTLAINIAYEIALLDRERRVILAELSLGLGKLPLYLNVEPRHTTADLLKDIHRLDLYFVEQALTQVEDNFSILSGPLELPSCSHTPVEDILMLTEALRHMAEIVVLDVPCTYNQAYSRRCWPPTRCYSSPSKRCRRCGRCKWFGRCSAIDRCMRY